jgi:hypothetical protein
LRSAGRSSAPVNRRLRLASPAAALVDPQSSPEAGSLADIDYAMVRLPLAAVLGAALALRPKRRGTPKRTPAVVQTQIILAVVGAVIMLVVGASLARAFGIVGAANLIGIDRRSTTRRMPA